MPPAFFISGLACFWLLWYKKLMTVYRNVVELSRPGTLTIYHVFYTTEPVSQEAPVLREYGFELLVSRKVRTREPLFNDSNIDIGIQHHQRAPEFTHVNNVTVKLDIFYGVVDYLAMAISTRDTPSVAVCKGIAFHAYGGSGIGKYANRFGNVTMIYQIYKYLVDALSIPDSVTIRPHTVNVRQFKSAVRASGSFSFELPLDL